MKLVRHAWLLGFPALSLACQLVDRESDLRDLAPTDGSVSSMGMDASADANDPALDAGVDAASEASFCQSAALMDAALCDDFNGRAADALVFDGGPWQTEACYPATSNGNAHFEYGGHHLEVDLPTGPNFDAACALQSFPHAAAQDWTLIFDIDASFMTPTSGDAGYVAISRLDFSYDASVDGSLAYQSVRLLVGNDNSARLVQLQQLVGMAAPEEVLIAQTGTGTSFLSKEAPCNIKQTFNVNAPALDTARSTCGADMGAGTGQTVMGTLHGAPAGSAVLFLGFDDPATVINYGTPVNYDNVVLFPFLIK
jgi:hypothetical protein